MFQLRYCKFKAKNFVWKKQSHRYALKSSLKALKQIVNWESQVYYGESHRDTLWIFSPVHTVSTLKMVSKVSTPGPEQKKFCGSGSERNLIILLIYII